MLACAPSLTAACAPSLNIVPEITELNLTGEEAAVGSMDTVGEDEEYHSCVEEEAQEEEVEGEDATVRGSLRS